jgi:hypothetical protein
MTKHRSKGGKTHGGGATAPASMGANSHGSKKKRSRKSRKSGKVGVTGSATGAKRGISGTHRWNSSLAPKTLGVLPAAFETMQAGIQAWSYGTPVFDEITGSTGVTLVGSQPFLILQTPVSGQSIFVADGSTTLGSVREQRLSLYDLGGPIAAIAVNYTRYRFRRMVFDYVPNVGTNTVGVYAIGYNQDPGSFDNVTTTTISFGDVRSVTPSITFPCWAPAALAMEYNGKELWYIQEYSVATEANIRQATQGVLCGASGANLAVATNTGYLSLYYEIELYGFDANPLATVPFGLGLKLRLSEAEKSLVKEYMARLVASRDEHATAASCSDGRLATPSSSLTLTSSASSRYSLK